MILCFLYDIRIVVFIATLKHPLEKVEERFATGEINKEIYEKFAAKYEAEIQKIEGELKEKTFDSSNLENAVEKCLAIAQNLSKLWGCRDFDGKQKLQYLVFPEGVEYNKKNDAVRTGRVNALFAAIEPGKRDSWEKEKGDPGTDCLLSNSVPRTGFEPAHF